jgi:hypothetical protein
MNRYDYHHVIDELDSATIRGCKSGEYVTWYAYSRNKIKKLAWIKEEERVRTHRVLRRMWIAYSFAQLRNL